MKKRWLRSKIELDDFARRFSEISENPLCMDYLNQGSVRGFYVGSELVGGYVVNTTQPLRYYQWIPSPKSEDPRVKKFLDASQASEITCIWGDRNKTTRLARRLIYWACVVDALRTGKTWIFGGSVVEKVALIHRQVLPKVVYKGLTTLPNSPSGQVYCAHWLQLVLLIPIGFSIDITQTLFGSLMKKTNTLLPARLKQ